MKEKITSSVLLLIMIFSYLPTNSVMAEDIMQTCTIITVKDENRVLFLNNEDNDEMHQGRIYFFPATKDKNGKVMFGYRFYDFMDFWVGGVNDQGLCFDQNGLPYTTPANHPEREEYSGVISTKMIEDCSSVEEVKENIFNYWGWAKIAEQQMHFADKTGDACVFGLDTSGELYMSNITENHIISTNIELVQYDTDYIYSNCWRYQEADDLLNSIPEVTIETTRNILETVALEVVMYSYIIDLTNMAIYLYAQGDFEHEVRIDIEEELAKGKHSYSIDDLVKKEHGVAEYNFTAATILIFLGVIGLNVIIHIVRIRKRREEKNMQKSVEGEQ